MDRREPSYLVTCILAVVLPLLAGAGAWLLSDATVSADTCATGRGGALTAAALLVFAGPAVTAWRVRHATAGRVLLPVVISIFLSLISVYMGAELWWTSHNCMT